MNELYDKMEFSAVLSEVATFAMLSSSRDEILASKSLTDLDEVKQLLEATRQGVLAHTQYKFAGIQRFNSLNNVGQKISAGGVLTMAEFIDIVSLLLCSKKVKKELSDLPEELYILRNMSESLLLDEVLIKDITSKVKSDSELYDDASTKLKEIRIKKRALKNRLVERLNSFTKSNVYSKYLQDNFYTVRNGRYVLPVKSDCRSQVKGLLHEQSASGATVFIEPFEMVEINNDVIKIDGDELREIEHILSLLTAKVAEYISEICLAEQVLIQLDCIMSKVKYSISIDGILPKVNYAERVDLILARHPLIDKKKVVPINIKVGGEHNILVISGPNTGGKTVSLKTVGLFSLMLGAGVFLPCDENSEMAIFDNIFCDIGDMQDLSQSLSTFSSHILNLKHITESFTDYSLILLDEIGNSTEPREGASLGVGIINCLLGSKVKAIMTTHYPQLKEYALVNNKVQNAGMQFDTRTLLPTYKMLLGYPGSSNAIETAEHLGLSKGIVNTARQFLADGKGVDYEELLYKAGELKSNAERELQLAKSHNDEIVARLRKISEKEKAINASLEKINLNAKTETRRLVVNAVNNLEELVEETKNKLKENNEQALLDAKKLIKKMDNLSYELSEEPESVLYEEMDLHDLKINDEVYIKNLGVSGIIKKIKLARNEVEVLVGGKVVQVKKEFLAKPIKIEGKKRVVNKKVDNKQNDIMMQNLEVKVLGCTVSEAIEIIEPIIESAEMMRVGVLRIVHGKGTGALGNGVQKYLKSNKIVPNCRYGGYGEGDRGVTIIEFVKQETNT